MVFVAKLQEELNSGLQSSENKKDFLNGLKDAIKDPKNLTKLLNGCKVNVKYFFL